MKLKLVILLLLLAISLPATASYLLVTEFHTYENSLHSFMDTSSTPIQPQCCDGQEFPNCTGPCNTILNYCFKQFGSASNFSEDETILSDCLDVTLSLTELKDPVDVIDFSDPPLTVSGTATWTRITNRGVVWPGGIQFFVRSTVNFNIVDYLYIDISLSPGQNLTNRTLHGKYFGENITFTASFYLDCTFDFYGENCDIFCRPGNSNEDGFYTCDSEGSRVCFEDYYGEDCNIHCRPANNTKDGFYTCDSGGSRVCFEDYFGEECNCKPANSTDDGFYTCDSKGSRVCSKDYYGEECKVYCTPEDSDKLGHYMCASDGSRECLEGYKSGGSGENCTECIPTPGCSQGTCDGPGECNCLPGYAGPLCIQDLDVCGHVGPCRNQGNCTNMGPDSYQCSCQSSYEGVNCTDSSLFLSGYMLVIVSGVGGLLAPMVILLPCLIILCCVAVRRCKKKAKKDETVNNPEQDSLPHSSSCILRSEATHSDTLDQTCSLQISASEVETPSFTDRQFDDPNYAVIPTEQNRYTYMPPPVPVRGLAPSVASTHKSEAGQSYTAMSILSMGESPGPYNNHTFDDPKISTEQLSDYDVPPTPIPAHGQAHGDTSTLGSETGQSSFAMSLSMGGSPGPYNHTPDDPRYAYYDIIPGEKRTVHSPLPLHGLPYHTPSTVPSETSFTIRSDADSSLPSRSASLRSYNHTHDDPRYMYDYVPSEKGSLRPPVPLHRLPSNASTSSTVRSGNTFSTALHHSRSTLRSGTDHNSYAFSIRMGESPGSYSNNVLLDDPRLDYDIVPSDSEKGAFRPTVPPHGPLSISRRSERSNSLRSDINRHRSHALASDINHARSGSEADHRSLNMSRTESSSPYNHAPDDPRYNYDIVPSDSEKGAFRTPVPPYAPLSISHRSERSNSLRSEVNRFKSNALGSEGNHSRPSVLGSDRSLSMSRNKSMSPYNGPVHPDHEDQEPDYDIIPEEGDHDYDIVPAEESAYDLLAQKKKTGYESYDVPRKHDLSS